MMTRVRLPLWLRIATAVLLVLFPVSWAAPLVRAGLLPLFSLSEVSVLSGIAALWETDRFLSCIVALFALVAPMAKLGALVAMQSGRDLRRWHGVIAWSGRLAMADIFLISLYITLAKGVGVGRIETAWGLYLFTFCVLGSLVVSALTQTRLDRANSPNPG